MMQGLQDCPTGSAAILSKGFAHRHEFDGAQAPRSTLAAPYA
jgi:hypothetical protein